MERTLSVLKKNSTQSACNYVGSDKKLWTKACDNSKPFPKIYEMLNKVINVQNCTQHTNHNKFSFYFVSYKHKDNTPKHPY